MSTFPWEQTGKKKEEEPDGATNAAPGTPPFAAGAPISDLFQKAFSEPVIQETSIAFPEKSLPSKLSVVSYPLFSMEIPDLSSLGSKQEVPGGPTPPFIFNGKEGSLPIFLSKKPPMAFPGAPATEVKDTPKVQTTSKRQLPVFEMVLPEDGTNVGDPLPAPVKPGINATDISIFPVPGPNLSGPGPFSFTASPQPAENDTFSPSSPFCLFVPPLQPAAIAGSDDPSSADPFSASHDPFAQGIPPSAADPFAGQINLSSAVPGPSGLAPFPFSGPNPSFSGGSTPSYMNTVPGKKPGIGGKMVDVPGKLATSISELANSIVVNVRNLTKGKSLLDKMEKIKEGNIFEEDHSLQSPDASVYERGRQARGNALSIVSNNSPFGPAPSGLSSFAPSAGGTGLSMPAPQILPDSLPDDHAISISPGDFVKVTPVENPLFDFPEALKIDNNSQSLLPAYNDTAEGTAGMKQRSSDTLHQPEKVAEGVPFPAAVKSSNGCAPAGSKELDDIREKLESSAGNVSQVCGMYEELSGNMAVLGDSVRSLQGSSDDMMTATCMKFDSLDERIVRLESHLLGMEQQVAHVLSENRDIMSSLSSIEQHISELVGSYTALVSKIQENAQENDDRFSALSAKAGAMENLVPRFASMERSGTEVSATVQDLQGNVAKLGTDISNVSASQQEIRDEMMELSKYAEGELKKIGAKGYKVADQSIQLAHIMKNSSSIKLCMEWLEFLMELVGRNNLPDILSYYEELGWITEEARMELMRYAEGIDFYMEKPDWKLNPDDHVKSVWFIENLAGIKVDKNKLSVIDRDIEKVRKGSEIYNI